MYKTATLVDTIDVTLSNDTDHDISLFLPTYHMMDSRLIKGRKGYKAPSPCRQNRMLEATTRCRGDIIHRSTRFKLSLIHFNKLNVNNNHLSTKLEYNDHYSVLNFPLQFTPTQVDSTTNLLDDVVLTKVVLRPTKKRRSVGPHKSILKKNDNQRKSHQENKKFSGV